MTVLFRSKIDGTLIALGLLMPCVSLVAIGAISQRASGLLWIPALLSVLVAAMVVWISVSTYYELRANDLLACAGPFRWRIPIEEITAVRESKSARSGPALSMERLEITYRNGRVLLISPKDKDAFLAALRRRAPWLPAVEPGAAQRLP